MFTSLATTADPSTGTTAEPPLCPYQYINTINPRVQAPDQFRTDHNIAGTYTDEYIEGRFTLKNSQFVESYIQRSHKPASQIVLGKFKARFDAIIEYIDNNNNGIYEVVNDTTVQTYDLTTDEIFFTLPIAPLDANNNWFAYVPNAATPVVTLKGVIDKTQHPCTNFPLVPSPTSLFVTVNFGGHYIGAVGTTKLALNFQYNYAEDVAGVTQLIQPGTRTSALFEEFNPYGFPTSTSSGTSVKTSYTDDRNGLADQKPQYSVYFSVDTTARAPFTIQAVEARRLHP